MIDKKELGQPSGNPDAPVRVDGPKSDTEKANDRLRLAVREGGGPKLVSGKAGIPTTTLQGYLTGGEMKLSNAIALAAATGVRLEWLARGEGPMREGDAPAPGAFREAATGYDHKPSPPDEWDHANLAWALEFAEKQIGQDAPAAQRADLMVSAAREFRRVNKMPPLPDFRLDLLARSLEMAEGLMHLSGQHLSNAGRIRRALRIYAIANGDDDED